MQKSAACPLAVGVYNLPTNMQVAEHEHKASFLIDPNGNSHAARALQVSLGDSCWSTPLYAGYCILRVCARSGAVGGSVPMSGLSFVQGPAVDSETPPRREGRIGRQRA